MNVQPKTDVVAAIVERCGLTIDDGTSAPVERRAVNCNDFRIMSTSTADYLCKMECLTEIVRATGGIPIDRRALPWLIVGSDGGGPG